MVCDNNYVNSLLLEKQLLQFEAHWRKAFRSAQEPNKI